MSWDSFPILPYSSNRCVGIHVDVSSIGQKKFYFFLPKTIWRFHQVVPAPLLSSDKSLLSCSSYLCSEKISSKFHSISISSWLWTRITLIISRSFSVSNFWIPKKSFSFILSESSFCSRSFLLFSASSIFRFISSSCTLIFPAHRKDNLLYYTSFYFYLWHMPVI